MEEGERKPVGGRRRRAVIGAVRWCVMLAKNKKNKVRACCTFQPNHPPVKATCCNIPHTHFAPLVPGDDEVPFVRHRNSCDWTVVRQGCPFSAAPSALAFADGNGDIAAFRGKKLVGDAGWGRLWKGVSVEVDALNRAVLKACEEGTVCRV